jgi:hypothetical protein
MTFLYIAWVMYCVAPMALVISLYLGNQGMTIDIEYVGGPDDGHRTMLVAPEGKEENILVTFGVNMHLKYEYIKTNRRTTEGFLIYEFAGYKK